MKLSFCFLNRSIQKIIYALPACMIANFLFLYSISAFALHCETLIHPFSPAMVSGSFGEYRPGNRYHHGLDYKTYNRNGLPVFSPADTYVSRIHVSDTGYGYALYLSSNSYYFILAHLNDFQGKYQDLEHLRYAVDKLKPGKTASLTLPYRFSFKQGEQVARTGESGIGPPHLHFEAGKDGFFYDPLSLPGLKIDDDEAPELLNLYIEEGSLHTIYQLSEIRTNESDKINLRKRTFELKNVVNVSSPFLLSIGTFDRMGTKNRNSVFMYRLYEDDKMIYEHKLDKIHSSDLIRAFRTYHQAFSIMGREYVCVLYSSEKKVMHDEKKVHNFRIEVYDAAGN